MKRLYIARHAKSSWDEEYITDFERPLNKRGIRDAPLIGDALRTRGVNLQHLRSSPAVRALTTARLLAYRLSWPEESIVADAAMYGASDDKLHSIVLQLPDDAAEAMLVGHNPGMHMLAERLVGFDEENLPTCAVVGVEFTVERWSDIRELSGTLLFYEYPKLHISR